MESFIWLSDQVDQLLMKASDNKLYQKNTKNKKSKQTQSHTLTHLLYCLIQKKKTKLNRRWKENLFIFSRYILISVKITLCKNNKNHVNFIP